MSSTDLVDVVEVVADRLEAQLQGARVVYRRAVPKEHADSYAVVADSPGDFNSDNLSFETDARAVTVYVTSACRDSDPETAAREAAWVRSVVAMAMDGWRPPIGRASWRTEVSSGPPTRRDDSLADFVFFGTDQFLIQYQP